MIRRWFNRAALAVTAAILMLFTLVGLTVATETGTHWSLQQLQRMLPALQLEQIRGSWWRGLRVAQLRWQDEAGHVQVQQLQVRVSLPTLLTGTLHISELSAQTVDIVPAPAENTAETAIEMPAVTLPFAVKLAEVRVDRLNVNSGATFHDVTLGLHWRGSLLTVDNAALAWEGGDAQITGQLKLVDDYPLSLDAAANHEALPGALSAQLRGSLRALEISATLDGEWPLRARGELQPLEAGLPLSLELTNSGPITFGSDAETLRVDSATLAVNGELEQLAGTLRLELHEKHYGHSQLYADLHWQDDRLAITKAHWQLADGSQPLTADCSATLSDRQWRCDGHLRQLSLAPLLQGKEIQEKELQGQEGNLSTRWQASGNVRAGMALTLALLDIRGELNNAAISGEVRVATEGGSLWQLHHVELTAGSNTVTASGALGDNNSLLINARLTQLAQLYPPLQGSADLNATVKGNLSEPDINADLDARNLVYGDRRIARLSGKLQAPQLGVKNSTLRLALENATLNEEHPPLSAVLQASGDRRQQQWRLVTETGGNDVTLACQHTLDPQLSDGHLQCSRLDGHLALRQHKLPLALTRAMNLRWQQSAPFLAVEPFCLVAGEARLCLDQGSGNDQPLVMTLSAVPLEWLTAYSPRPVDLSPGSHMNASLTVHQWQPLNASAQAQISSFSWPNAKQENAVVATLDATEARLTVTPEKATLQATARSAELGDLTLNTSVDDPNGSRQLDGELRIRGLQTGAFGWLLPDGYQLSGQLDAGLQLGGNFAQPDLRGTITLVDGMATLPGLEESLRELALQVRLDERRARFNGDFRLGTGRGEVSGVLNIPEQWQQWQLQADVVARAVQFSPLPDSSLTLSSELALKADAAVIRLEGDVHVDRANIQIRQLPPDTQRVSSDVEIVGGAAESGPDLFMDLRLNLGERFHFAGLGAEVDLTGQLRLQQQPHRSLNAHGEVRISKGRYRAYGQRLTVQRGSFLFNGPPDNPDIDLRALRDLPPDTRIKVGVDVTGTLRKPLATLYSSPPMADTEAAYYLLTGKPPPEFGQATQLSAESTLLSIGVAGASARAAGVAEKIGISDFQISAAEGEQGTEAQVSGYLTPRLYVRYGTGLQQGANSVTFQYRVTRQLLLEAVTGLDQALDILYSFSID